MLAPEVPENEAVRVDALHSLNILDTAPEDRFDRYTRISAQVFDTPISLISLVDRYRQWFKSSQGLNAAETPREISFCGHAILGDDVFEVQNARRDPRFRDNPLVVDSPNICFYAGAPLKTPSGHKLGTLCIIDKVPRRLSEEDKRMLMNLADMVVGEMINYIDTETGLANRNALMFVGARCFDAPPERRRFSLLLLDTNDMIESQNDSETQLQAGEPFSKQLHGHFPEALSVSHMGGNKFCVLLRDDPAFDEIGALSRLCVDARDLFCANSDNEAISPLVGRIKHDREKYSSFEDVMRDAEGMFYRREKMPWPRKPNKNLFVMALNRWRKTTF